MKLRIRGNSLRLRVTRSEVDRIRKGEAVREKVSFSPDHSLEYVLEGCRSSPLLRAAFAGGSIRVSIPEAQALAWATGPEISLVSEQAVGAGSSLKILVEKDFSCLHPADGEDDGDTFARPEA